MSDLTYEEWMAARERAIIANRTDVDSLDCIVEAVLGCPCPPKPAPEPFRKGQFTLVRLFQGRIYAREHLLTPNEADAMAVALMQHARYARKQGGGDPAPSVACSLGCVRPRGHSGVCETASA